MPAYAHCRICERAFRIIPECKWHRVRACCKEHYEAIVGRRQGYPSRIEAAKAQAERAANDELRDLAGIAARKAEIDAKRPPIVVVPDEPEAEKAVRATCGDAVGAGVGVGAVREYHGSARRGKMLTGCLMLAVVLGLCGQVFATNPMAEPVRESFDVIDVNTVYSETGDLIFVQLLFLDFEPWHSHHEIHAWRMVKSKDVYPVRDGDGWRVTLGDGGLMRVIRAENAHWTAEIGDKEVWEREQFPITHRRGLADDFPRPKRKPRDKQEAHP